MVAQEPPIRVLCVDDNDLVGDAIEIKLRLVGGFEWLGQISSADNLINEVRCHRPDVVLLDIDMPGRNPLDALEQLSELFPSVRVVMLTGHVRRDLIEKAIEAGAWGYVCKSSGGEPIVQAIRNVKHGEFVLGPVSQKRIDGDSDIALAITANYASALRGAISSCLSSLYSLFEIRSISASIFVRCGAVIAIVRPESQRRTT
jgi:DNA-binding NarL/FixJ family response regulator